MEILDWRISASTKMFLLRQSHVPKMLRNASSTAASCMQWRSYPLLYVTKQKLTHVVMPWPQTRSKRGSDPFMRWIEANFRQQFSGIVASAHHYQSIRLISVQRMRGTKKKEERWETSSTVLAPLFLLQPRDSGMSPAMSREQLTPLLGARKS